MNLYQDSIPNSDLTHRMCSKGVSHCYKEHYVPAILPTAISLAIKILDLNASAAISLRGRKSLGLNRRRTVPLGTRRNNPGTC